MSALRRRSLADQVADALVQLTLDEDLAEGASLPPTAELSDRFGVFRTVTREALAPLTGQGILSRSQGHDAAAEASRNPPLMLDGLVDCARDARVPATKKRRSRGLTLEAVVSGDGRSTGQSMRHHLSGSAAEYDEARGVAG